MLAAPKPFAELNVVELVGSIAGRIEENVLPTRY
jgi:hypothetical protein